jgi:hypothetical protein
VSAHVLQAPDFPDLLLAEMGKPIKDRERDVTGTGVLLRVERCAKEGDFVIGEFCRKQIVNIPPQAGPSGLRPIILPHGEGIGHVAAFRYHRPTRIILLQNNSQCATPHRIALYVKLASSAAVLYSFSRVLREDAWARFKNRNLRSFTVRFASPENLEALDDQNIAAARGAKMLAEAYEGLDLTISVGVGRKKKKFLSFEKVKRSIQALLDSDVELRKLEVSANEDETGRNIDFWRNISAAARNLNFLTGTQIKIMKLERSYYGLSSMRTLAIW